MSRQATMSVMGLYQWDNGLFDLLVVPEGVDKDTFTDNLMAETFITNRQILLSAIR